MLAAVKAGHLSSYTEKRINCSINTWVRGPGITAFITIVVGAYLAARSGRAEGVQPSDLMPAPVFVVT